MSCKFDPFLYSFIPSVTKVAHTLFFVCDAINVDGVQIDEPFSHLKIFKNIQPCLWETLILMLAHVNVTW